jgi:3-polyprenyl-4-hydroxybenzoate decarboxylase
VGEVQRLPAPTTRFVIVVGPDVDAGDLDDALFHWLAHSDASRDMTRFKHDTDPARSVLGFDATPKGPGDECNGQPVRDWPPILRMNTEVRALVERRWAEYFPSGPGTAPAGANAGTSRAIQPVAT